MADEHDRPVTNRQRIVVLVVFAFIAVAAILTQLGVFGNGNVALFESGDAESRWILGEWISADGTPGWQAYTLIENQSDATEGGTTDGLSRRVLGVRCLTDPAAPVTIFVNAGVRLSHEASRLDDYRYRGCARPRTEPGAMSSDEAFESLMESLVKGEKEVSPENRAAIQAGWEAAGREYKQCIAWNGSVANRRADLAEIEYSVTAGRRSLPSFLPGHFRDLGVSRSAARCIGFQTMTVLEAPTSFNERPVLLTTEIGRATGPEISQVVHHDTLARYLFEGDRVTVIHPARPTGAGCGSLTVSETDSVSFLFPVANARETIERLKVQCGITTGFDLRVGPLAAGTPQTTLTDSGIVRDNDRFREQIYQMTPTYQYSDVGRKEIYSDCRDPNWSKRTGFECPE